MGEHYLAGLDLTGREVVVVGGGTVAQRRLPRLINAGARIRLIAPEVTPSVEAMAEAGEIDWVARDYSDGDLTSAWYVLTCTDIREVNEAVGEEAQRRRVFCVRSDEAERGSAVTPAVGEHDGLRFGVLAGGRPRRSAAVRDSIVDALTSGLLDRADGPVPAGVALVGGGPGDPGLITVRGRELLARADVVVADRLAPRELLAGLSADVEVIDAAKVPYGRALAQEEINRILIDRARAGRFVVRLKGGDPYVFGRGFEEFLACVAADVPVFVVPGVTSATAVPAVAGVPVTHRGVAHEVTTVSGHLPPGHPDSLVDWQALARLRGTLVLLMAVDRMAEFARVLCAGGRSMDTPTMIIREGTTGSELTVRTTLDKVATEITTRDIRPPAVIVIGPVAALGDAYRP